MKKSFMACLLLILFASPSLFAKTVSREEALRVAIAFIERENSRPELRVTDGSFSVLNIEPILSEGHTVAFLVNLSPQGFLLMPGFTELSPVRFTSFSANYESLKDHPLVQQLIAECDGTGSVLGYFKRATEDARMLAALNAAVDKKQVEKNESLWPDAHAASASVSSALSSAVTPLLRSRWNQGYPYNLLTPTLVNSSGQNEHTVTGCGATAQAQIMFYWRYPDKGQGSKSYYWTTGNQTLAATFDSYYPWELMQNTYNGSETEEQKNAVALLMRDVGYSTEMDYNLASKGGSSSYPSDALTSFRDHYKFHSDVTIIRQGNYAGIAAWFEALKGQIDKSWPALLAIYSNSGSGHAVVVDGYRTDSGNQVHLNMGWSGSYDAYYSLDSILAAGEAFTKSSQVAVINIHPPDLWTLTASPTSCMIPTGSNRCTVNVQGTNPDKRTVQMWARGGGAAQAVAFTDNFAEETFSFPFAWVTEGTATFYLYDVAGGGKTLLATTTATGMSNKPTLKTNPGLCTIATGNTRCTVSVEGTNPDLKQAQLWVLGPGASQAVAFTGVFAAEAFSFPFEWVPEGTVTFYLYDVTGGRLTLLATTTAIGRREAPAIATLITSPGTCTIATGSSRCTVNVQGTNPNLRSAQVWALGPGASQAVPFTGIFAAATFSFPFEWVTEGTVMFYLYDVTGGGRTLLATATATGKRDTPATATLTTSPGTCTIAVGSNRCTVNVQGTNPNLRSVQLWSRGQGASQAVAFTGVFAAAAFSFPFEWVTEGTVTFYLYDVTGGGKTLLATATATGSRTNAGNVTITFSPNPVSRSADLKWHYSVTLRETNGIGITLTGLTVAGKDYTAQIATWFGTSYLAPYGQLSVNIASSGYTPPAYNLWQFTGNDTNGHVGLVWSATVVLVQ